MWINPEIQEQLEKVQSIKLRRDITLHLKRGHRWVFADCFDPQEKHRPGPGLLMYKGVALSIGLIQPEGQLRFRSFALLDGKVKDLSKLLSRIFNEQWNKSVEMRRHFNLQQTNAFRLINGEGDGFPGMVIDLYGEVAVVKHDDSVFENFYSHEHISQLLLKDFPLIKCVYLKRPNRQEEKGEEIYGVLPEEVIFKENDVLFSSQIKDAAKTGFFLDQRDNRELIGQMSAEKRVLNLFSYTGGFSLLAAKGRAAEVVSVDIAPMAIKAIERNFQINKFINRHSEHAKDVFAFLSELPKEEKFDIVITDPPSFAPNQKAVDNAKQAYIKVFSESLRRVRPGGIFAPSSCSAHITFPMFEEIVLESFSKARRRGTIFAMRGQPLDHPYPLAMPELRYLKFALIQAD